MPTSCLRVSESMWRLGEAAIKRRIVFASVRKAPNVEDVRLMTQQPRS